MVSGRADPALDHRLCRIDHDGGAAHAWHRRCRHHRRAAARLAADPRPPRGGVDRRDRTMDRCFGDDCPSRGRNRRHDDADAQSLARRKNHGDIGTIAPSMARPEKRRPAADDARGVMRRHRVLFYRRTTRDPGTDRHRSLDDGLCAYRLCGAAYADAGAEKPRALARLYLRHHGGVRLACSGDGGSRSCGCHFRISSTLPAREATAHPRVLNSIFNSTTQSDHLRRTNMEVILLERVAKLGQMGEVVRVKDGFARNFLLKRGKALRATADNRARFDCMKAELEARNLKAKADATKVAEKIDGRNVMVLRQASEGGQLFGSVTVRDIIASFESDGVAISRSQIMLDAPIKTISKHSIAIAVHPEVEVSVTVTVARSADEAERINRGEDISTRQEDQDAAAEAIAAAGEFFDPEARRDDLEPQAEPASDK